MSEGLYKAKVLFDYAGDEPDELKISKGSIITILEANGNWWLAKDQNNQQGILPSNYVERIVEATAPTLPPKLPPKRPRRTTTKELGPSFTIGHPPGHMPRETKPRHTPSSSSTTTTTTTKWDFSQTNINMAQPIWRKDGFSELMLDGFFSSKDQELLTAAVSSSKKKNGAFKKPYESRIDEFNKVKSSIHLVTDLIDALVIGPLPREVKKVAWDVQSSFRECLQHFDTILSIDSENEKSSSGPSAEACFPYITRVANIVRSMSPGQVRILPGGWIEPTKSKSKKGDSYFHPIFFVVSKNDNGK